MQLALRPYVTTGIAIVGASVIAVAPIAPTPPDIKIPNPVVQVDRAVELTAGQIENAFNQVTFVGAQLVTTLAKLPAPLVAQLLGIPTPQAQALLALGSLGLVGSALSTTGAVGTALQDIVDQLGSFDIVGLVNALIGAPATLIDGLVNGGYGADLSSLIGGLLPAAREAVLPPILAGGLIHGDFPFSLFLDPPRLVLVGLFPTLQFLVSQITDRLPFGGATMMASALAPLTTQSDGAIEGAVNALVFNLIARPIVAVAGIVGTVLAPLIGEEAAAGLPVAALGLLGPLISGPGALGTAIQNVVDQLGQGNLGGFVSSLIGAPATLIDGVVNGGYGPNLQSLLPDLPTVLPPGIPVTSVLAGGLIRNPGFLYPALLQGLGLKVGATGATLLPPGVFPTLQKLVDQILGALPGVGALAKTAPVVSTFSVNNVPDTSDQKLVTLNVASDPGDQDGKSLTDGKDGAKGLSGNPGDKSKADDVKEVINANDPGPDLGKKVSDTAKPDNTGKPTTTTDTDTLDMTDGGKVIPDTPGSDNPGNGKKKGGGSNPVGAAISSVAKGLAGAVRGVLGG